MAKRVLKEVSAPYTVNVNDETIGHEPVVISRDGEPFVVVLPYAEYIRLMARQIAPSPGVDPDSSLLDRERAAFRRLLPDLLRDHQGEWVAIVDGQPVEFGPDFATVIVHVRQRYGQRAVYVQEILESPRVYKIESPRLVRR
jgi:hypothetical protein